MMPATNHLPGALWERVDMRGGLFSCWPWQGNRNDDGYGRVRVEGSLRYTHRAALELALGRRVTGFVCHRCDNPPCCNPLHLYEGTNADNMRDMAARDRGIRGRLTDDEVERIRRSRRDPAALAIAYGVSLRTVYRALQSGYRTRQRPTQEAAA